MRVAYIHIFPSFPPDLLKVETRQEAFMLDVLLDVKGNIVPDVNKHHTMRARGGMSV
jgi:hypothetical protein